MGIDDLTFDERGLIPCVVQQYDTGEVLMVAWMNAESLELTRTTGTTWFWSRSRRELWNKGLTSGNIQTVKELYYDCDGVVDVPKGRMRRGLPAIRALPAASTVN